MPIFDVDICPIMAFKVEDIEAIDAAAAIQDAIDLSRWDAHRDYRSTRERFSYEQLASHYYVFPHEQPGQCWLYLDRGSFEQTLQDLINGATFLEDQLEGRSFDLPAAIQRVLKSSDYADAVMRVMYRRH